MNSLSRVATRSTLKRITQVKSAPRMMSTILDKKEMAEESKFIRSMEARQQQAIRANLERIMALEDHHDEKKELVELLGKGPFQAVEVVLNYPQPDHVQIYIC